MSEQELEPQEEPEEPETEPSEPGDGDELEQGDEGDEEDAPEPEPEPEPSQTPEALEKRAKTLEQFFGRYAAKVSDLYEKEATRLLPCPLCPDQHKGFVHLDFAGRVPEEVEQATKLYLGIAREQEYADDPGTHACQTCAGKGKTKTGSQVPGHESHTCPNCKGYGYMPPPTSVSTAAGNGVTLTPEAITESVLQNTEDTDEWGEPRILPDGRENPNFGKMPNRKVLVEPYGVTANLTAMSAAA